MSEQVSLNQADALVAAATAEHPASENLAYVTHEANAYADIIARMERTESELRALLQESDLKIWRLSQENQQLRNQVVSQKHGQTQSNGDAEMKDAWYVFRFRYVILGGSELLLLAKEHREADDRAVNEKTSDDAHCHGWDGDLIAVREDDWESWRETVRQCSA